MSDTRDEGLLDGLVDRQMYQNDPLYHAQVAMFRKWLTMTRRAIREEGLGDDMAQRVLSRMVYGVPDPSDAYLRRKRMDDLVAQAATQPAFYRDFLSLPRHADDGT